MMPGLLPEIKAVKIERGGLNHHVFIKQRIIVFVNKKHK